MSRTLKDEFDELENFTLGDIVLEPDNSAEMQKLQDMGFPGYEPIGYYDTLYGGLVIPEAEVVAYRPLKLLVVYEDAPQVVLPVFLHLNDTQPAVLRNTARLNQIELIREAFDNAHLLQQLEQERRNRLINMNVRNLAIELYLKDRDRAYEVQLDKLKKAKNIKHADGGYINAVNKGLQSIEKLAIDKLKYIGKLPAVRYAEGGLIEKWEDLTIKDKALWIRFFVSKGVKDAEDMEKVYNLYYASADKDAYTTSEYDSSPSIFDDNSVSSSYAYGGNLFDGGGDTDDVDPDKKPWYQRAADKVSEWSDDIESLILDAKYKASSTLMENIRHGALRGQDAPNDEEHSYSRRYLGGPALRVFLLNPEDQKRILEGDFGWQEDTNRDYGLVKRAVGDRDIPVYQVSPDKADREDLVPIGNVYEGKGNAFIRGQSRLVHAGDHPGAIYVDGVTGDLYYKGWDLNDYGGGGGYYNTYDWMQKIGADALDLVGNPIVVTTGYLPITRLGKGVTSKEGYNIQDLYTLDSPGKDLIWPGWQSWLKDNGLHPISVNGKIEYAHPEATVVGHK